MAKTNEKPMRSKPIAARHMKKARQYVDHCFIVVKIDGKTNSGTCWPSRMPKSVAICEPSTNVGEMKEKLSLLVACALESGETLPPRLSL